jgi:hypothetical protein
MKTLKKRQKKYDTQPRQVNKENGPVQITESGDFSSEGTVRLTTHQLAQLLSFSDRRRSQFCPLPIDLKNETPDQDLIKRLKSFGWITKSGQVSEPVLSELGERVLNTLLSPQTRVQLILGSPTEMISTHLYSSIGYQDEQLTIYTNREVDDLHIIRPQVSPSEISEAILANMLLGSQKGGFSFEFQLSEDLVVGFLTVLDLLYARRLEAKLDGELYPFLNFSDIDLENRFNMTRMGEDLLWLSALVPFLFPYLKPQLYNGKTKVLLDKLATRELLTPVRKGVFQPSDFTLALSEALIPLISFASIAITDQENSGLHLGFFVGPNANAVFRFSSQNGENLVEMTGMNGIQFSRLLFEIGLPENRRKE